MLQPSRVSARVRLAYFLSNCSPLRLELLHYVQEIVVHLGLRAKFELDLIQVRESILHLKPLELLLLRLVRLLGRGEVATGLRWRHG
jgi:hypothetical protein